MTFSDPIWLLLAIPILVLTCTLRWPSPLLRWFRFAVFVLALMAMAGAMVRLRSRAGVVVLVADRSLSMPGHAKEEEREAARLVQSAMSRDRRFAVVGFAESCAIEYPPGPAGFSRFVNDVGQDASNLGEALDMAASLIPRDAPGRILVLSDGRWTGRDPVGVAAGIASRGIAIDYRCLERSSAQDLAIDHFDSPPSVAPNEVFLLTAWVRSPISQKIDFALRCNGTIVAQGKKDVPVGLSHLTFRLKALRATTLDYDLTVKGSAKDPMPENNRARVLVSARGQLPVLLVSESGKSNLARLLQASGIDLVERAAHRCVWSLEELAAYSAVVLENIPATDVGESGMRLLAAWTEETGAGLMVTGGQTSFGTGGYYKSPLDPILPVSMELREEHRKLSVAIVVAMDRSGSMMARTSDGRTKMQIADIAAAEVIRMLGPQDEFGLLAVDSSAHLIVPLSHVKDKAAMCNRTLSVESMGGGIFIYEALSNAVSMVAKSSAGVRHVILLADAADSEEEGAYRHLLDKCRAADITVTVVGLGSTGDCDAKLLMDIAARGGGRCLITMNAHALPRLFAQDTIVVARSTFIKDPTAVRVMPAMLTLTGQRFDEPPSIGGYNLCYLRNGADMGLVTQDEYTAPVVAAWRVGLGRALAYTGEADGKYTGPIAGWKDVGMFFTSLVRWCAGSHDDESRGIAVKQTVRGSVCHLKVYVDPDETSLFSVPPQAVVLRSVRGVRTRVTKQPLRWSAPDTLVADVPLAGDETALVTICDGKKALATLPPVCVPYSPEFKPVEVDRGRSVLARMAEITGGRERVKLAGIWKDVPRKPRLVNIGPWLLWAAIVFFLLEIFERRTGLIGMIGGGKHGTSITEETTETKARGHFRRRAWMPRIRKLMVSGRKKSAVSESPVIPKVTGETPPVVPGGKPAEASVSRADAAPAREADEDMLDALRSAQDKAKKRLGK